jgi:hypothetical protein
MNEYETRLLDAYDGEIFGEAFFGTLAAAQPDADRREKLATLQTVEARTARSLRRLLADSGLRERDPDLTRRRGEELAQVLDPENWHEILQGLLAELPKFLDDFVLLRDIAPRPGDPALVALVNHEQAIERFAQLELAGAGKAELKALQDHLRRPA